MYRVQPSLLLSTSLRSIYIYFLDVIIIIIFQSVASTTPILQHSDPIVSPIGGGTHYRPTPASKHRGIPEVGKLPKTVSVKIPTIKFTTGKKLLTNAYSVHFVQLQFYFIYPKTKLIFDWKYKLRHNYPKPNGTISNTYRP